MIDKPLEGIEAADIESLCFRRAPESRTLEFKRELPGNADADKKEFLDDVVALANSHGGDLIFGIDAIGGMANEVMLLELEDRDAELLRLENILRDSVQPRLRVHLRWVPYEVNRGVLVVRIPASLSFPHMRFYKGSTRFCSRNSAGKYDMDVQELRQAFTQSEQLNQRFRLLHEQALRNARGEEMPFALKQAPTVVATIAPRGLFREQRDFGATPENAVLPPKAGDGVSFLRTLEGVLAGTALVDGELRAYTLTHRTGQVDAAWTIGGLVKTQPPRKMVWPKSFEEGLCDVAGAARARLLKFGIDGPWVIYATIFGIHGFQLARDAHFATAPAWRDGATLPLDTDDVTAEGLKPLIEHFWLLFGEVRPQGPLP